jgi:glyoxylase-like metal-dependent hydrolase (beta-lactamase superfamily II)
MSSSLRWDLYVLEFARSKEQPWVDLVNGTYDDRLVQLPFSFVVARHDNDCVLVDTGFMQDGIQDGFLPKLQIPEWISPLRMLAEIGISCRDVRHIFVTHAHFDHMGSISAFPEARIYIQKAELLSWYEAIALPQRFGHLTKYIDPNNLRAALDAAIEHRLTLIEGDKDSVLPGIHVRVGSGHTIAQQFIVIETPFGRRVISGDCVYSRRSFEGHNHDGVYVPLNSAVGSTFDQLKTIDKMHSELNGDIGNLVLQHDSERWLAHPILREVDGFRIVKIA